MVRIFEVFAAGYSILFAVFCESLVVSWIYGKHEIKMQIIKYIRLVVPDAHSICITYIDIYIIYMCGYGNIGCCRANYTLKV